MIDLGRLAVARSGRVLAHSFGETDNFVIIVRLVPSEFLKVAWEDLWGDWMPEVRAALADALREISDPDEHEKDRILGLLEGLLSDSTYLVRRSPARTHARIDSGRPHELCRRWIRSAKQSYACGAQRAPSGL